MIYLNEIEPYAAAWLRELMAAGIIPKGHVDERSITEVTPDDLRGYSQCHFFGGIGMWPIALALAGWPEDREVWTGSAPCQPFSSAGKQKGKADARHLWPEFHRLIDACQPAEVYGEQVADGSVVGTQLEAAFVTAVHAGDNARANRLAIKIADHKSNRGFNPGELPSRWLTDLRRDLGGSGYSLRWEVLGAHSVGSPTIRQRLFWSCWLPDAASPRHAGTGCGAGVDGDGTDSLPQRGRSTGSPVRLGGSDLPRSQGHAGHGDDGHQPRRLDADTQRSTATTGRYDLAAVDWLDFRDGKTRPIERGLECLAHGCSFRGADGRTGRTGQSRAKILKAIGNAIHPGVGAAFIRGWEESRLPMNPDLQRSFA